jgi:predicted ferric reductase
MKPKDKMHVFNLLFSSHPLFATTTTRIIAKRVAASWPWYAIRAAGFVAAGLLVVLMLSGIGQVTGYSYRFIDPIKAWAIHKALAIALCIGIAIHGGALLLDHYVPFSLQKLLIPFVSNYNNGTKILGLSLGALAVAFGIFAMYGVAIIVLSSLGWIDSKAKVWRKLHYISYLVAIFVFLHGAYTGTDLKYGLFRAAWIGLGLLVVVGIIARIWRAGTTKKGGGKPADYSITPARPF